MTNEATFKECLFNYVRLILSFEQSLVLKYNLEDNPYSCQSLFPRKGTIDTENGLFEYRFHGSGCSFDNKIYEVHYDYHIVEADYITTVPWKFWRFVVSEQRRRAFKDLTQEDVGVALKELDQAGVLKRLYPEYSVFGISFSWYTNYDSQMYYG
jgi:hypothetical protein